MTFTPRGSGSPSFAGHHSPRSTDQVQAAFAVQQPPFVDQQRGVHLAGRERIEDRGERRDRNLDADRAGRDQPQHQPRGRGRARDPDPQPGQIGGSPAARRHDHRTEAASDRRAVRQHLVARRDRRVDPDRYRDDVRAAVDRQPVERRGVVAAVGECAAHASVDAPGAQRVEHERVVRVDRIGERDRGSAVVRVRHASGSHYVRDVGEPAREPCFRVRTRGVRRLSIDRRRPAE